MSVYLSTDNIQYNNMKYNQINIILTTDYFFKNPYICWLF